MTRSSQTGRGRRGATERALTPSSSRATPASLPRQRRRSTARIPTSGPLRPPATSGRARASRGTARRLTWRASSATMATSMPLRLGKSRTLWSSCSTGSSGRRMRRVPRVWTLLRSLASSNSSAPRGAGISRCASGFSSGPIARLSSTSAFLRASWRPLLPSPIRSSRARRAETHPAPSPPFATFWRPGSTTVLPSARAASGRRIPTTSKQGCGVPRTLLLNQAPSPPAPRAFSGRTT
mmetsp:Transcript_9876/g.23204  ORF Transcript_9876/g.23204 Transcript_9876/m.23204 type:complete len:238 (+) Transcript_9876:406-1119(+)